MNRKNQMPFWRPWEGEPKQDEYKLEICQEEEVEVATQLKIYCIPLVHTEFGVEETPEKGGIVVRKPNQNSNESFLPPTTPSSLDRAGVIHPTAEARPGALQRAGSFRRSGGKRRSADAREKRLRKWLAYHRRLVMRKELPHSHLMQEHSQAGNVRKCLGQEF